MSHELRSAKICDFCKSQEGKLRHVERYRVVLREIMVLGSRKLVCQICYGKTLGLLEVEANEK